MSNAAITIKSNPEISIRLLGPVSKLAKSSPFVYGTGLAILFLASFMALGFYIASLVGAEFAVSLPLRATVISAVPLIAGICLLIIKSGMNNSYKGIISLSATAGFLLGAIGYITLGYCAAVN